MDRLLNARGAFGASVNEWQLACPASVFVLRTYRLNISLQDIINSSVQFLMEYRDQSKYRLPVLDHGNTPENKMFMNRKVTFPHKEKYVLEMLKKDTEVKMENTNVAASRRQMFQAEDQQDISHRRGELI